MKPISKTLEENKELANSASKAADDVINSIKDIVDSIPEQQANSRKLYKNSNEATNSIAHANTQCMYFF